ncbi:MAG: alpha/beta hydrolase [Halioglobus sp.]|nr:alpha/beta hydrolase [Halioglobus sp.]
MVASTTAEWDSTGRQVTLNGERIAYHIAGSGPLLLLVHGMAGSSETWRAVMPALARQFTVLAPDLLGQGKSEKPRGDYSLGARASMLRDLLDELGYERATIVEARPRPRCGAHLVGPRVPGDHRLGPRAAGGSAHAQDVASAAAASCGREVTLFLRLLRWPGTSKAVPPGRSTCASAIPSPPGRWRNASAPMPRWPDVAQPLHGIGVGAPAWAGEQASMSALAEFGRRDSQPGRAGRGSRARGRETVRAPRAWYERGMAMAHLEADGRDRHRLGEDPFIPVSHGIDAHKAIPGSRLEIFDKVGHYPHCEAPERFVEVLVDFMDSTRAAHLAASKTGGELKRQEVRWSSYPLRDGRAQHVFARACAAKSCTCERTPEVIKKTGPSRGARISVRTPVLLVPLPVFCRHPRTPPGTPFFPAQCGHFAVALSCATDALLLVMGRRNRQRGRL